MPVCQACGSESPEGARFCPACGAGLTAAAPGREVRKTVSVVFIDLVSSTAMGERLDAETMRRVLGRYFEAARHVLESHGATVEKFIGDAVMAVFGVPRVHEDDAYRAVAAAARLGAELDSLNEELQQTFGVRIATRVGVNTGEVVAGEAGAQTLVTGDAVNVAARLQQAAASDEILIGEGTYRLVRDRVEAERVQPLELRGKEMPVAAYRLIGVRDQHEPMRRTSAPMIGREDEMALLEQAYQRAARKRACHVFTVLGAAGIGKSRLVDEFIARRDEATVLRGRCLPYGDGITFWPLAEMLRGAADVAPADPTETARGKLAAIVGGDGDADVALARVASLIGLGGATATHEEALWGVRTLLERMALARPLIAVVDDLHWAEPTFIDLLDHIADWSRGAPILLLCVARPELLEARPSWGGGKPNATSVLLEPLARADSRVLIEQLIGESLSDDLERRITDAAEGNPLFIEELAAMMLDPGAPPSERDGVVEIPPTVQALIAARLDRLEPAERALLGRASVVGRNFSADALANVTPPEEAGGISELTQRLIRKDLIDPDASDGEVGFRFRHLLVRDAAYAGLSKAARASLHERVGGWTEAAAEARPLEYEEIVGYHLEQAYRYRAELGVMSVADRQVGERAAQRLGNAGRRALARGDLPAARTLLERAIALLPRDHRLRSELLPDLGSVLTESGEFVRAEEIFAEAGAAATASGDERLQSRASITRLHLQLMTEPDQLAEAERQIERAMPIFEDHRDDVGLAKTWRQLALVHRTRRHFASMEEALRRAIVHARQAGDRREESRSMSLLSGTRLFGPMPVEEAIRECEQVLASAEDDRTVQRGALFAMAGLQAMAGEFAAARETCARRRALSEDLGLKIDAAETSMIAGFIESLAGDLASARRELEAASAAFRRIGEKRLLALSTAMLARVTALSGEPDAALRLAREAERTAAADDVACQVIWRSARALALARRGETEEAEKLVRGAVELAGQTDAVQQQGDAWLDLAHVLQLAERPDEAAAAAETAERIYATKGNRVSAVAARRIRTGMEATAR